MKGKIKIVSYLLITLLAFQVFSPMSNNNLAYAKDSISNIYGNDVNMSLKLKESEEVVEVDTTELPNGENVEKIPEVGDDSTQMDEVIEIPKLDNENMDDSAIDVPEEITEIERSHEEVEVEQENTQNNIEFASVSVPEDIDKNGVINQADLDMISSKYNVLRGQADYEARYDLNNDGIIDIYDITIVSKKIDTKPVLKGRVTADVLNVRSGPGSGYNKIGTLYYGDVVEILDDSYSSWYKIRYNNEAGFVSSEFLTKYVDYGEAKIIVIDPGHGGNDPGAGRADGPKEKELTLKIGLKVRDMLQNYGYTVIMTRDGDYHLDKEVDVDLRKRAAIANDNNADLFVSIHINSAGPTAKGSETYYHTTNTLGGTSKALATSIQNKLFNYLALSSFDRGIKADDFSVLRNTTMPAVLAEVAFISNPNEEALLITDAFQTKAAKAIVDGILDYLK